MKKIAKRLLIISLVLITFFIAAICLRVGNEDNGQRNYIIGGSYIKKVQNKEIAVAASGLSRQTIKLTSERKSNLNETYFRPSNLKALNSRFLEYDYFLEVFKNGIVPPELINTPENSVINYFSVLQQASLLTEEKTGGCGTVGFGQEPFPIAYSFLSENNKKSMNYEEFVKSFEGIGHINLIKLLPIKTKSSDISKYFLELEFLEGSKIGATMFNYYTGELDVIKVNNLYYIDSLTLSPEDFFCAAYHGWAHNAELYVETVYGNWCGLIMKQYTPEQDEYTKKILVDGVDNKKYLFEFAKLTNGTDLLINSLVKSENQWIPVLIDVEKLMDRNKVKQ